jgi:hypothetical protein
MIVISRSIHKTANFLDKEYLLISRIVSKINIAKIPIHPASATTSCPNGIKDAHSQKKEKKIQKKKSTATEIENLKQQH